MAERNCITFVWKVSDAVHGTGLCLESPEFYVNSLRRSGWKLRLNIPSSLSEKISVFLKNCSFHQGLGQFSIDYEISILTVNPLESISDIQHNVNIDSDHYYQIADYPTWFTVSQSMKHEFLPEGTLTVQCRLWKLTSKALSAPVIYHASTSLGIQHNDFKWPVEKFSSLEAGGDKVCRIFTGTDKPTFCVRARITGKRKNVGFEIRQTNTSFSELSLTCKVAVLDADGDIAREKESRRVLKCGKEWIFPRFITREFLIAETEQYLMNDQLTLILKFTYRINDGYSTISNLSNFSSPHTSNGIEKEFGSESKYSEIPTIDACTSTDQVVTNMRDHLKSKALNSDLKDMYTMNLFSDMVLYAKGHSFRCHKCILAARSPFFYSIISKSTTEYTTDLDAALLSTLLQFLYTGDIEDLDSHSVPKMYEAAEEYQISSLIRVCSEYLEEVMTDQNVCAILSLASKHQNSELKKFAEDYIMVSPTNILRSEKWKELVRKDARLIVDTMHRIYLENMNNFITQNVSFLEIPTSNCAQNQTMELKSNFLSLLESSQFSDFKLCTDGRSFSVHKNILWARSPVFKAMFSSNMKEASTNTLGIPDVDQRTMELLLKFIYSGYVADLQCHELSKLYYAADKYDIMSLKDWCSGALVQSLSEENVCELLMLSDRHGDEVFKKAVLDFVSKNEASIILSTEWKNLMKIDSKLASEAMYQIYAKKLLVNTSSSEHESTTSLQNLISSNKRRDSKSDVISILQVDLLSLYEDKFLSDFKLRNNGRTFEVHKNILWARSPVFKAMLSSHMKEAYTNTLDVVDVDEQIMDQMLRYMYTGALIEDSSEGLMKLYYAADKYQINCLRYWCSCRLRKKISFENVCEILVLSEKHGDRDLEGAVRRFLNKNDQEVFISETWRAFMYVN